MSENFSVYLSRRLHLARTWKYKISKYILFIIISLFVLPFFLLHTLSAKVIRLAYDSFYLLFTLYLSTFRRFRDLTVPSYLIIFYILIEPDTHFATIHHTNSPILFNYFAYFAYRLPHYLLLFYFYKLLPPFIRIVQELKNLIKIYFWPVVRSKKAAPPHSTGGPPQPVAASSHHLLPVL